MATTCGRRVTMTSGRGGYYLWALATTTGGQWDATTCVWCVPWLRAEGGTHQRGLASTGMRGVATPRGLGDYNLWAWGGDDLWAWGACTCVEHVF